MSRAGAFFDMDRTVVRTNTGPSYLAYAFRHGRMRKRHVAVGLWWAFLYKLTVLDTERAMDKAIAAMAGTGDRDLQVFCRTWFEDEVKPEISGYARRAIELHRRRGDVLVLLTASSTYAARPVAEHLGMDHVLATRVEVMDGTLTGRAIDPPCIGEGKVFWAEQLAREHDIDLDRSAFYTDSVHDMPMLLRVGFPVIVNPDFRLARLARAKGWRIERWS